MGAKGHLFQSLSKVDEVANNRRLYRRIDTKIFDLQQQMKE